MRYFITIICCFQLVIFKPITTEAQVSRLFPFQVLYAENAFIDEFGITVRQYSLLEKDQKIYLRGGHIIFVDYQGKFYEVEGDSITNLKNISDQLGDGENTTVSARPDLKPLFSSFNRYFNYETGHIHEDLYPIRFDFISNEKHIKVAENKPVNLSWSVREDEELSGYFHIQIKNIFDEVIGSIETDTSFIELNLNEIKNESSLYLLRVSDKMNLGFSSIELAIEVNNSSISYNNSFSDNPQSAVEALQIAYGYEKMGNKKYAGIYYKMSADLSERQIYKTLLEKFNERIAR